MGYACPVCEVPQRDGEHLAHHLAFTAMLHGDDHEEWLEEHAPEWSRREPAELAAEVTEYATTAEYQEVFEDTVHDHDRGRPDVEGVPDRGHDRSHDHDHDHGHGRDVDATGTGGPGASAPDAETRAAIEKARELARQTRTDADGKDEEAVDEEDGENGTSF
ncbi:DUF5810 domain-containing protein [Halopenitus sp. H-Gu1]|uniref:DUF5810 domain-containing protein n=1 Tax=Halopenitus sp. H-Gu1 TaxID=3242697 RepID=UPI00359CCC94